MSKNLNRKKPITTFVSVRGTSAIVTRYPHTSSATMSPGSFSPNMPSATPDAHTDRIMNSTVNGM